MEEVRALHLKKLDLILYTKDALCQLVEISQMFFEKTLKV